MIYDKTTQIFIVFIINHKTTINTIYLVVFVVANKRFVKIFTPPVMCPREVFAKIARDFQMICFLF
jgi:hypothetical protein